VYSASSEPVTAPDEVEWKPLPGCPKYRIYKDGTVIGPRGKDVSHLSPNTGRLVFTTSNNGRKCHSVSRVVLTVFVRPPAHKEEACHLDGNPQNNNLTNLRWGSKEENTLERQWLASRRGVTSIPVWDIPGLRVQAEDGRSCGAIARQYGIMRNCVTSFLNRKPLAVPRLIELMEISCTADLLEVCPSCGQPLSSSHQKVKE
jgi:hypothetical protein